MIIDKPNFFLLTGGPGVGKTTLIEELRRRGERVVEESHRRIIREGRAQSGGAELGLLAAREDVATFEAMRDVQARVFFDRGVIDSLTPQAPAWVWAAARRLRYNARVFVPPPWPPIYVQDAERRQTYEECLATHAVILRTLRDLNYQPIEVPRAGVAERADFVLQAAAAAA